MKKLPLLLTLAFIVLAVGGYFLYNLFFVKVSIEPWALVPESSVLVYESGSCEECIAATKQSSVWEIVQKASFYTKQNDSLKSIFKVLTESQYNLISLHVTKKDDFDFVFYTKATGKDFDIALDQWKKNKQFKFSQREFSGVKIQEVSYSNQIFSWVFLDEIWAGSFTPFLVEDVVRTYASGESRNFKSIVSDVYQMPKMKSDAGNIYVHIKNLADWLNVFTGNKPSELIKSFGKSSILDVKTVNNNFVLNGFSSDSANTAKYILSVFTNQSPVPFDLKKFISNRTVTLTTYGISDGEEFWKNLKASSTRKTALKDTLSQISKSLPINVDKLFKSINGGIGLCAVESKGKSISNILLAETSQSKDWIDIFNGVSAKLSVDTIFFEKFSDYEIRELPLFRFPEKILSPLVTGFDKCYYTSIGNTILIGENLEELKKFLEDIDHEETWGKSVTQNKFLETTLLESNISFYVSTPRVWNILSGLCNAKWRKFISENNTLLQSLGMGAIQFSHLNESFYTNISWNYKNPAKAAQEKQANRRIITNFESTLASMFVVKSHVNKQDEVLMQDSLNGLHLISSDGKELWKLELEGLIKGDIKQIDFFNNGKLQYLFATAGKLHVLDRLGKYVAPFPIAVTPTEIEYVSVVDYDHSRKYRFLLADKAGALWMYDKAGNNLDGWKPKNIEDALAVAPQHHRIRGKDYVISIRKDGKVYILNRRGETLKNFPVDIGGRPAGDYFLEAGNSLSSTYFVLVTRDGFRVKINMEGKIQSREALVKTSGDARFALVAEESNKTYLILRQESKQLVMIDESGKEILTNDYVGLNPLDVQYTDYGAGTFFVTITDVLQNLSFVYDAKGTLMTTPPLEAYFTVTRPSGLERPRVFSIYQKALSIQVLP